MACTSCKPDTQLPVGGCVDKLGAECVQYTTDQSVAQALEALKAGPLWQTLFNYLQQNPAFRQMLSDLLTDS